MKQDSVSNTPLEDAEFAVKDANGVTVGTMVANAAGEAEVEVPIGKYSVVETKVPTGYLIDKVPAVVTVERNRTIRLVSYNKRSTQGGYYYY